LQTNPLIHVNDPNGLFTSDELTRVHDAVDAVVEPCGGWVMERTDGKTANGTVAFGWPPIGWRSARRFWSTWTISQRP